MLDGLGLRLELKLHDARDSNVRVVGALHRPAESVPADQPGRGLTMAAEHFLFAQPELDQIPAINARHPGVTAPPVRLLPTNLAPAAVGAAYRGADGIVIGQREEDLAAVELDFAENPLLMVLGDTKSGKTTLLRHIIATIRDNSTPDRVAFTVLDRRLDLVDEPLFADNEYTANFVGYEAFCIPFGSTTWPLLLSSPAWLGLVLGLVPNTAASLAGPATVPALAGQPGLPVGQAGELPAVTLASAGAAPATTGGSTPGARRCGRRGTGGRTRRRLCLSGGRYRSRRRTRADTDRRRRRHCAPTGCPRRGRGRCGEPRQGGGTAASSGRDAGPHRRVRGYRRWFRPRRAVGAAPSAGVGSRHWPGGIRRNGAQGHRRARCGTRDADQQRI